MKIFTTAEILEELQIGQSAEMIHPVRDIVVSRSQYGLIVEKDALSTKHVGQPLPMTANVLIANWKLKSREIPFLDAVDFLKKGKKVTCEFDGRKPVVYEGVEELIHIYEAVDGKWYFYG